MASLANEHPALVPPHKVSDRSVHTHQSTANASVDHNWQPPTGRRLLAAYFWPLTPGRRLPTAAHPWPPTTGNPLPTAALCCDPIQDPTSNRKEGTASYK